MEISETGETIADPGWACSVVMRADRTNAIRSEPAREEVLRAREIRQSIWQSFSQILADNDFPVYAAGVTHRGPYKDGPGEINVVVSVGGMVVRPGDLITGDHDGVLAIPQENAESIITAAEAQHKAEQAAMRDIAAGTYDRKWVDEVLKARGCDTSGAK